MQGSNMPVAEVEQTLPVCSDCSLTSGFQGERSSQAGQALPAAATPDHPAAKCSGAVAASRCSSDSGHLLQ